MAEVPDADGRFQERTPAPRPPDPDDDHPGLAPGPELSRDTWQARILLGGVGTFLNLLLLLGLGYLIAAVSPALGAVLLLFQFFLYGWLLFGYLSYRQCRQDELLQVLTTAIASDAPLPTALRFYVEDRPHDGFHAFLRAAFLCILLPGYYWLWYRRYNYDHLVERLAVLLEQGTPLHVALQEVPGLAPREVILAAAVGRDTGQMALCLRYACRRTLSELWGEVVPRLLYPLGLFVYVSLIVSFWMTYLLPKMQRIYHDFDMKLPATTDLLGRFWPLVSLGFWLTFVLGLFLFVLQLNLTTVRWYFPVLGWFYRKQTQSRALQMLGVLLEAGKPVPEALTLLAQSGYFQGIAVIRLEKVREAVAEGQPLAGSLTHAGLLPSSMTGLVQSAERVGNLPRALGELGEHLAGRLVLRLRWLSLIFSPLALLAIGFLVYIVALSLFLPLIKLMEELSR